jgi:hypothetical protein
MGLHRITKMGRLDAPARSGGSTADPCFKRSDGHY